MDFLLYIGKKPAYIRGARRAATGLLTGSRYRNAGSDGSVAKPSARRTLLIQSFILLSSSSLSLVSGQPTTAEQVAGSPTHIITNFSNVEAVSCCSIRANTNLSHSAGSC